MCGPTYRVPSRLQYCAFFIGFLRTRKIPMTADALIVKIRNPIKQKKEKSCSFAHAMLKVIASMFVVSPPYSQVVLGRTLCSLSSPSVSRIPGSGCGGAPKLRSVIPEYLGICHAISSFSRT